MPDIQITGSADQLSTPDDLWALFTQLQVNGWVGSIGIGAEHSGDGAPLSWTLDVHTQDDALGVKSIHAGLGDWKVTIGSTVTVMTQATYAATYGAA